MKGQIFKSLIFSFFFLCGLTSMLFGQTITNADILTIPKEYLHPRKGQNISPKKHSALELTQKAGGNLWIVYSDREDNPTYETPASGRQLRTMQFMEAFYVVDETSEYLHLVKYDPGILHSKKPWKIVGAGEDYGWAPKEKLLMWNEVMMNNIGFKVKVLTAAKMQGMGEILTQINEQKKFHFFNSPQLLDKNDNVIHFFRFLFILKETENAYLVTPKDRISVVEGKAGSVLGWISKNMVEIWDQRVVLEPNTSPTSVEERRNKNIKATIAATPEEAMEFKRNGLPPGRGLLWNDDRYEQPFPPDWKRLPILEKLDGDLIRTGVTTNLFDVNGKVILRSDELLKLQKEKNTAETKYRNVNLVFVIDGTKSMKNYFPVVANALERSIERLRTEDLNYKLGVVVYRDYSEKKCPSGDRFIEEQKLVSRERFEEVVDFIRSVSADDCTDRDLPEAVYAGLIRGLNLLEENDQKEETNVLVLIGDAGNHRQDAQYNLEQVKDLLIKTRCHLLSYQVANFEPKTYQDFIDDSRALVRESSKAIGMGNPNYRDELRLAGNTFRLNYPDEAPVMGEITFSLPNTPMKAEDLEGHLFRFLGKLGDGLLANLQNIDRLIEGFGAKNAKMNAFVWDFLVNKMHLSEQDLANVYKMEKGFQFYVQGYTPLSMDNLSHPLYRNLIMVTNEELESLRSQLYEAGSGSGKSVSQRRQDFVDVFKGILASLYGKAQAEEAIKVMSSQEVRAVALGLPFEFDTFSNCPWPERIVDVYKMPTEKFEELTSCLRGKYDELGQIPSLKREELGFVNFTTLWWWIPNPFLP